MAPLKKSILNGSESNIPETRHDAMHREHTEWFSENALWREDIANWEKELTVARADLHSIEKALRDHEQALRIHAAAIRCAEQDLASHEHALAKHEKGGEGSELLELVSAHRREVERRAQHRDAHERVKRHHHVLIARWNAFVKSLTAAE